MPPSSLGSTLRLYELCIEVGLRFFVLLSLIIVLLMASTLYACPSCTILAESIESSQHDQLHNLSLNVRSEGSLEPGQSTSYELSLTSGQFTHVVIHVHGMIVTLRFFDPFGKRLYGIDSPFREESEMPIGSIAKVSGSFRLQVATMEKTKTGSFSILMDELRTATPRDADSGEAEEKLVYADEIYKRNDVNLFGEAIQKYQEALALFHAVGDRYRQGSVLHNLGVAYHWHGEYQKALDYFLQSLPLLRSTAGPSAEGSPLTLIGEAYWFLGDYKKALDHFQRSLPAWRAYDEHYGTKHIGEGWALNEMGSVYSAIGETQEALNYYHQALESYQKVGNRRGRIRGLAIVYTAMGTVYASTGEKQTAIDYLSRSLPEWRAVNDPMGEARALHHLGEVYASLGESDRATEHYKQAIAQCHSIGYRYGEAQALHSLGMLQIALGEPQNALNTLQRSLILRREMGERRGRGL